MIQLRGIPVLFIPGNAGSYKQVRPIAAEAASYYYENLQHDANLINAGVRNLDFFTVDFNEDITAFHGQTLLDQAEYLNEAVRYILSLYFDPQRVNRDSGLPDPTSVIIVGHSMGGVVARTMLTQPNYKADSINTIVTMSAPHARPPVTFDGDIVHIYDDVNDYWREAYAPGLDGKNPLDHVTLVSIAGGTLDTIVPSDYASLESLIPETHGFTVYTTGIPGVWTSADHQAILWCDQFRKVVTRSLFDVVNAHSHTQTRPREERMRVFRKRLLTGLETDAQKSAPTDEATTLLVLGENESHVSPAGERLVLEQLGSAARPKVHLLTIPEKYGENSRFNLLTDSDLDHAGDQGRLEVLLCNVVAPSEVAPSTQFVSSIGLPEDGTPSTRLICKNTAADTILLPASTPSTKLPFYRDGEAAIQPFSYLRYTLNQLADFKYVAVIDKAESPSAGFVAADFSDSSKYQQVHTASLQDLSRGFSFSLPAGRPMTMEVQIPALASSLIAYNVQILDNGCSQKPPLFAPLIRQHLDRPYESKYFVNAKNLDVSLHGNAPYLPPPIGRRELDGVSFEFWTDSTCDAPIRVKISLDVFGSLGKLNIRYRTVFAAFPLLIVTLVLRKQFRAYDTTGVFITFSESLDQSLRRSIPLLLLSLTLLATSLGGAPYFSSDGRFFNRTKAKPASVIAFHRNDLLIGTDETTFTFLVPVIGVVCIGVCTLLHYLVLALSHLFSLSYAIFRRPTTADSSETGAIASPIFYQSTPRRRMLSTAALLFLVSTFIPYQFAYLVACLVQLFTSVRALRIFTLSPSISNANYYNYCHSILLLMMWVLPINLPILAVWVRNLSVHWLTPFSSHHNVLSIMPFILLVENLTTGRMVPQISSRLRHVTSIFLFCTALCAAIYGVSHAYMLHYLVNIIATWLVVLHATSTTWSIGSLTSMFEGNANEIRQPAKAS